MLACQLCHDLQADIYWCMFPSNCFVALKERERIVKQLELGIRNRRGIGNGNEKPESQFQIHIKVKLRAIFYPFWWPRCNCLAALKHLGHRGWVGGWWGGWWERIVKQLGLGMGAWHISTVGLVRIILCYLKVLAVVDMRSANCSWNFEFLRYQDTVLMLSTGTFLCHSGYGFSPKLPFLVASIALAEIKRFILTNWKSWYIFILPRNFSRSFVFSLLRYHENGCSRAGIGWNVKMNC